MLSCRDAMSRSIELRCKRCRTNGMSKEAKARGELDGERSDIFVSRVGGGGESSDRGG